MSDTKKSKLDAILWEKKAYNKLYKTWVHYGKHMELIRPKLEKEGKLGKVIAYAKELEERVKGEKRHYESKNRIHKR